MKEQLQVLSCWIVILVVSVIARPSVLRSQNAPADTLPRAVLQVGHGSWITSLQFSADGKQIVTASADQSAIIWDVESHAVQAVLRGHHTRVNAAAFSPDGKTVVTGAFDGVQFWDAKTGAFLRPAPGFPGNVHALGYSPDGKILLTAAARPAQSLWDTATGEKILDLTPRDDRISCLAFTPNGKAFATGREDGTITIWVTETGTPKATLAGPHAAIHALAFSPDASVLASAGGNSELILWDTATRTPRRQLATNDTDTLGVSFSPDGSLAVTAGSQGAPQVWDAKTGKLIRTLVSSTNSRLDAVAWSPDGTTIAAGGGSPTMPGVLELWNAKTGTLTANLDGKTCVVTCITSSPDGAILATGAGNRVSLWDAAAGARLHLLPAAGGWVQNLAFSPDGRMIAAGGWDSNIPLYDVQTGKLAKTLSGVSTTTCITFSSDNSLVAAGSGTNSIVVWNVADGQLRARIALPEASPGLKLAISPDNRRLAAISTGTRSILLFDLEHGVLIGKLMGHTRTLLAAVFSPDAKTLATSAWDGAIDLWNASDGQQIAILKAAGAMHTLGFADATHLACADKDGKVEIVDLTTKHGTGLTDRQTPALPPQLLRPMYLLGGGIEVHSPRTGHLLATMYPVPEPPAENPGGPKPPSDEMLQQVSWFVETRLGYFSCSDGSIQYLRWNLNGTILPGARFDKSLRRPDMVQKILNEENVPPAQIDE